MRVPLEALLYKSSSVCVQFNSHKIQICFSDNYFSEVEHCMIDHELGNDVISHTSNGEMI